MKKYDIEIEEVLRRVVNVEAENYNAAMDIVEEKYRNEEIVLDSSDYCETSFNNLYSKKLDNTLNIFMRYNPKEGVLTIIHDDKEEASYVCDTVRDIESSLKTYIADYIEDYEIESDKEMDEIEREM